ncbi:MAG: signal recognition particle-docking protein FtsY [Candidatus Micrarchaeota archaeon]
MFEFLKKKVSDFVGKVAELPQIGKNLKKEKKDVQIKLTLTTQVKSLFSDEIELKETDIHSTLEDFELELLEADVALEVAEQIKEELKSNLIAKKIKKSNLHQEVSVLFYHSIKSIMSENTGASILEQFNEIKTRPIKIMFTGPNGSGKTTTIAKIANMLKKNEYSVVIAAADTFRAAAIEQMEIHGNALGVKIIKGKYGADPTSVAFDAVNHAKAHNIDVVLIDTAGRQETNINLLNELKKMVRVIKPEMKIYIGESISGNAVIDQVGTFNKELGLDGVILTKLDCDAKGGTIVSISKITRVPVLYTTCGQKYNDIEMFDPDKIARNFL